MKCPICKGEKTLTWYGQYLISCAHCKGTGIVGIKNWIRGLFWKENEVFTRNKPFLSLFRSRD